MKKILVCTILLFSLTTCKKDHILDCFKSSGKTTTESRDVTPFTHIDLQDNVDLVIKPNSTNYIKVTAGDNLIDGIITELSGNTLYIRNENRCNWMRSFKNTYTVEIGVSNIEQIEYYGSGNITCVDTIRIHEFTLDCWNGSGTINLLLDCDISHLNNHIGRSDMHVKGTADVNNIYINDVGTMDASELISSDAYIRNRSTGDIKARVSHYLEVAIEYNGNIFYSGNPQISKEITGKGKLITF